MSVFKKIKSGAIVFGLCLSLSACAAPPALQILSFAADGISYLATEKTLTDHGLSAIVQQDCKMTRPLQGEEICLENEPPLEEAEVIALVPTDPVVPDPEAVDAPALR